MGKALVFNSDLSLPWSADRICKLRALKYVLSEVFKVHARVDETLWLKSQSVFYRVD